MKGEFLSVSLTTEFATRLAKLGFKNTRRAIEDSQQLVKDTTWILLPIMTVTMITT
jgi:hypothetical protein